MRRATMILFTFDFQKVLIIITESSCLSKASRSIWQSARKYRGSFFFVFLTTSMTISLENDELLLAC